MSNADHLAIVELTVDYCWSIDSKDWPALRRIFTTDATAELGGELFHGIDAITARIAGALDPIDVSQHLITNHQVRVDGDRATCRCYLHAQHERRNAEGGQHFVVAGRYEDELVRTPAGWRIAHRRLAVMWREGNPKVLRPNG